MTTAVLPNLTRRAAALIFVLAAHLMALLLLVTFTRSRSMPAEDLPPPVWILRLPPQTQPNTETHTDSPFRARRSPGTQTPSSVPKLAQPAPPPSNPSEIDWAEEARSTAIQEVQREEQERRRSEALAPPKSALFGPKAAPAPSFHWYRANTRRFEPLRNGGMLINLSDNCALIIFPFPLLGCTLEKVPARGDLFDHMRDAPEFGAWKEH
jgi:hypothetical protein